jgi:hypothetical protein
VGRSLANHPPDGRSIALPESFGDESGLHGRPSGVECAGAHSCSKRRDDTDGASVTQQYVIGRHRRPLGYAFGTRGRPMISAEQRNPSHGSPFVH